MVWVVEIMNDDDDFTPYTQYHVFWWLEEMDQVISRHVSVPVFPVSFRSGTGKVMYGWTILKLAMQGPDCKDLQIAVDYTSTRHFRIGSMSGRRQSEGICSQWGYRTVAAIDNTVTTQILPKNGKWFN